MWFKGHVTLWAERPCGILPLTNFGTIDIKVVDIYFFLFVIWQHLTLYLQAFISLKVAAPHSTPPCHV